GVVEGAQEGRVRVRRPDDDARADGGDRPRGRPPRGLSRELTPLTRDTDVSAPTLVTPRRGVRRVDGGSAQPCGALSGAPRDGRRPHNRRPSQVGGQAAPLASDPWSASTPTPTTRSGTWTPSGSWGRSEPGACPSRRSSTPRSPAPNEWAAS